MRSLTYRQFVMRKRGWRWKGGWREGETEMVEGIGIRQYSRNNAFCIKKVNAVWIPIRNCLYQKFIYVSILKPRR